jgi:hypothetical protein
MTCQLVYLKVGANMLLQPDCPHCGGIIVDWTERGAATPYTRRLDEIRHKLDATPGKG